MFLAFFLSLICEMNTLAWEDPFETLPVELYYFKAEIVDTYILLSWGTATEVDNYGFDVERSTDLFTWEFLEFIPGHGTSNIPRDYFYQDTSIVKDSLYYYRLKQIDIIGSFTYSDTIAIRYLTDLKWDNQISIEKFELYQNYPNPFNPITTISFSIPDDNNINLSIYDIKGSKVAELVNQILAAGSYKIKFDINAYASLSSGTYFIRLNWNNSVLTKKLILLK